MTLEEWMRKHRVSILYAAMDEAIIRAKIHQIKIYERHRNQSASDDGQGSRNLFGTVNDRKGEQQHNTNN